MKNVHLFAAFAIVWVALIAGCKKDTFEEIPGVCPVVVKTSPENGAIGVPLFPVVTAMFNEKMDAATITQTSFTLRGGGSTIAGTVSYNGVTAAFTPSSPLALNTIYTGRITTAVKDALGNALQADYVWSFTTQPNLGPLVADLKSVERFGIIAGAGVHNNAGFSEINNMDVGISPGFRSSITGFPPAVITNGAIYAADDILPLGVAAMLAQAKLDLNDAYLYLKNASSPAPVTVSGDLGGTILPPGIYTSTSTLLIQSGDLRLDAQGDPNAVWFFQVASDLTTIGGAGGNIILINGAQAKNVFWQIGSSATLGNATSFKGNVLALSSITLNPFAAAVGRMLAINGSVVLTSSNKIDKP